MDDPCLEPLSEEELAAFEGEVPLLERLPDFAVELEGLLRAAGEAQLALQVPHLWITNRCRCGDDFCATFDVRSIVDSRSPIIFPAAKGTRYIELEPETGLITVEVFDGKISTIEALYRDDVRGILHQQFPV